MTQVIASSKSAVNVLTATNPNDFIFHSSYNSLKIIASGIFNQTVPDGTTYHLYSFSHGLGYTPMVVGFCKTDNNNYAVCPYEGLPITGFPFYYYFSAIGADSSKVYVELSNVSGSSMNFSIKYYIFEVPL